MYTTTELLVLSKLCHKTDVSLCASACACVWHLFIYLTMKPILLTMKCLHKFVEENYKIM